MVLANSIEAHSRRWAVRIIGLPAPTEIERTPQAKYIVTKLIHEKLKLERMSPQDIDCAHHVGAVTDKGKQTMLVRFFARDLADDVMKHKRNLKGTGILI
jgi:hypothetical protein